MALEVQTTYHRRSIHITAVKGKTFFSQDVGNRKENAFSLSPSSQILVLMPSESSEHDSRPIIRSVQVHFNLNYPVAVDSIRIYSSKT